MKVKVRTIEGSPNIVHVKVFSIWENTIFIQVESKEKRLKSSSFSHNTVKGSFSIWFHDFDDPKDEKGSTEIEFTAINKAQLEILINSRVSIYSEEKNKLQFYLIKRNEGPLMLADWENNK